MACYDRQMAKHISTSTSKSKSTSEDTQPIAAAATVFRAREGRPKSGSKATPRIIVYSGSSAEKAGHPKPLDFVVTVARRKKSSGEFYKVVVHSLIQQDEIARKGLPYNYVKMFQDALEITPQQTADLLQTSARTLQRIISDRKKLDSAQSGRLLRTAQISKRIRDVLGDEVASAWLREPQPALNYRVPLELLETEPGARAVEQLIGRIDYGVYT